MKLTDENLANLAFTYTISSGPNVCIYYTKDDDNFYATLHKNPKKPWDVLVCELSIFTDKEEEEIAGSFLNIIDMAKNRIRIAVLDFISKDRGDKIDSILN